jgi:hypothetical protein
MEELKVFVRVSVDKNDFSQTYPNVSSLETGLGVRGKGHSKVWTPWIGCQVIFRGPQSNFSLPEILDLRKRTCVIRRSEASRLKKNHAGQIERQD